jgi:hypothetical protein
MESKKGITMPNTPKVTIITPTTGKKTLFNLIETITRQKIPVMHLLLWDDKREDDFANGLMTPEKLDKKEYWDTYQYMVNNIILKGNRVNGIAAGSALRAIGLMAANTDFVTFADDDIMWEDGHLESMLQAVSSPNTAWAYCKRKIWAKLPDNNGPQYELIGIDEFESIGEDSKLPYKMVDNNSLIFRREFGVSGACVYRETKEYNDDRLFYDFLKTYGGEPAKTGLATVNQICPNRLIGFFRQGCTKVTTP